MKYINIRSDCGIMAIIIYNLNTNSSILLIIFFFLNDPATTKIYPLPLPDPLPISPRRTPEVGAKRERAPVDARLHFALEERLLAEFLVPAEALLETSHH